MAYEVQCGNGAKNTGINELCQDIGAIVGFIKCPWDFKITTETLAKLEATWQAFVQSNKAARVYPFPQIFSYEWAGSEAVYQDGPIGSIFVNEGKDIWTFMIESSRYKHEAFKSHTNQKCSIVLIDEQGRVHGVTNTDDEFLAINMQRFTVEKLKINDGTNGTTTKITMQLSDVRQWEDSPAIVIPSFSAKGLEGLKDVNMTIVSSTASLIVAKAAIVQSGTSVIELSETVGQDFKVLNAALVAQTPTNITNNEDGTYSFAFSTPLVSGTYSLDLKTPALMTTQGYESAGAATFTI